jgi:uncharacterized membrane protein
VALILAAILGGFIGATLGNGFGALVGAALGWLLLRSVRQQRQIEGLMRRLEEPAAAPAPPQREPLHAGPPAAPAGAQPVEPEQGPDTIPHVLEHPAPELQPTQLDGAPEGPPALSSPARASFDPLAALQRWLFGGNTIVKVGIGILFVGLAFLARFASEHVQVPVELRLAAIAVVALALLVLGWRLRLRRTAYAQVLQGGAIAVLYLTLFVAFRYYAVLAAAPVFALMVLVAALAAALAVLQEARALAVIGALGGFATPLLVSTGSGNAVALFTYYLVLDLGIAAVAWHRTWRALNLVGFLGTFIVATAWGVLRYRPTDFATGEMFLVAYFLLFAAILVMPARRAAARPPGDASPSARADAWVDGTLLFALPTITFVLQLGLVRGTPYGAALSALALAAFYVLLAAAVRQRAQAALLRDACLAIGTVFLTLVIPFALDARSTAGAWALEGAGLVWIGLRQRRGPPRAFGYALLGIAGICMLYAGERHGAPAEPLNAYLFNALMAGAAALAAAFFVHRHDERLSLRHGEALAEPVLVGWAMLWLLGAAALEIHAFVGAPFVPAAWLASVSGIAGLCIGLAVRFAWRCIAWPALAHAPLLAVAVLVAASTLEPPLRGGGWWAWPLALAVHAAVLRLLAPRWPAPASNLVHALGALVLAGLGALEGRAIAAGWGDPSSAWAWLGWFAVPAALLVLLPRPAAARRWPVREHPAAYRLTACGVLAAGLLLWTLIANVASDGSARPLPHVPLLNPLDIGIGIALAAIALWLRAASHVERFAVRRSVGTALLGVAGFVWLNAMLVRGFHHYAGVPYRFDAWSATPAVQTGLTLLWTATALVLMWLSASRSARAAWMVGAALLAAVVLKLLLVDLSGTGTLTRIVSFIGVGVLMLVIGYVAPLPAKPEERGGAVA